VAKAAKTERPAKKSTSKTSLAQATSPTAPAAAARTGPAARHEAAQASREPDEAQLEALAEKQSHPVTLAPGPHMLDANPAIPASLPAAPANGDLVFEVQSKLTRLGYAPGPADGALTPRTRRAIMHFQNDAGLQPTGEIDSELLRRLRTTRQVDLRFDRGPAPVAR